MRREPLRQRRRIAQQAAKGNVTSEGAIVRHNRERPPRRAAPTHRHAAAVVPVNLIRRQNGEADAFLGHGVEGVFIGRAFRQPYPFWLTLESPTEIANAPPDFGRALPRGGERENHVMIRRGDRVPVAPPTHTGRIARLHRSHGLGRFRIEPFAEGRAYVERTPCIQIYHACKAGTRVGITCGGTPVAEMRFRRGKPSVALAIDACVPVVVGSGRRLGRDDFEPGIFARRLVQVMVNNDGMHQRRLFTSSIAC